MVPDGTPVPTCQDGRLKKMLTPPPLPVHTLSLVRRPVEALT